MAITIKPPKIDSPEGDRLKRFKQKPEDFTDEMWENAKTIAMKIGVPMPQQMAESAFYFYYMGASYTEIADKLNIPINMVLYTAVHYDWASKKKLVSSVRAGEKVLRADSAAIDLVTDAIVATASIYKQQIADVIRNPENAKNCPMIPKNYKDFMTLLQMLQSLQTKDVVPGMANGQPAPTVNVNIANLPGGTKIGVNGAEPLQIKSAEQEEEEKLELLRLLQKAKNS